VRVVVSQIEAGCSAVLVKTGSVAPAAMTAIAGAPRLRLPMDRRVVRNRKGAARRPTEGTRTLQAYRDDRVVTRANDLPQIERRFARHCLSQLCRRPIASPIPNRAVAHHQQMRSPVAASCRDEFTNPIRR
jgi:hypothetical protein